MGNLPASWHHSSLKEPGDIPGLGALREAVKRQVNVVVTGTGRDGLLRRVTPQGAFTGVELSECGLLIHDDGQSEVTILEKDMRNGQGRAAQ